MSFLVGKVVLDVRAGAPNNGRGADNMGQVKTVRIGRDVYPYVSAQAFRRWLRDTLAADEPASPVTRSGSDRKQQAYTDGRPDRYLDDDLFGYMVATKGGSSRQRDTVLATGTLVAVGPHRPAQDFGTMSRGFPADANPVIHEHEHYTAELASDLLLDLARVGVFETGGSGLKVNLTAEIAREAAAGAEEVTFRGNPALRLAIVERRRRVAVLLRALAALRGGAKQSMHYGDRTPALLLLAPLKGGVNPFTRVVCHRDGRTHFSADVLREEIGAWSDELDGTVRIGWAPGFLGEQLAAVKAALAELVAAGRVTITHPRVMLSTLAEELTAGTHDDWFEDPIR